MNNFFLYIDILGFGSMLKERRKDVAELFKRIDGLNVFKHPTFRAVVFSDTLIAWSKHKANSNYEREYIVMYLCEFVQDLKARLIGLRAPFRAVIVPGDGFVFRHATKGDVPWSVETRGRLRHDSYAS